MIFLANIEFDEDRVGKICGCRKKSKFEGEFEALGNILAGWYDAWDVGSERHHRVERQEYRI